MRRLTYVLCLLLSVPMIAQVGIGTTTPTKMLDVDGQVRFRDIPPMVSDGQGNVGHKVMSSVDFSHGIKYSIRTSTPNGNSLYVRNTNTDGLYVTNGGTVPYIDLDLTIDVILPPSSSNMVTVEYFVPMAVMGSDVQVNGYLGSTFFRDGVPKPEGDRKYRIADIFRLNNQTNHAQANIGFVMMSYTEVVDNIGATPMTINFEVMGYIEQAYATDATSYRFNNLESWQNLNSPYFADNNKNWGVGIIKYTVMSKGL